MGQVKAGWKKLVAPDGKTFDIDPSSVSTNVQDFVRESVMGGTGRVGDSEKAQACFIECDVLLKAGQKRSQLWQDGAWQIEGRTRTIVLSEDAGYVGDGSMGDGDKLKVRYESADAEEVVA